MYDSLNGKVALVTGGGSGIGRATSEAFARLGCKVVVSDMNGPGGLETVKGILEAGGEAVFIPANVTVTTQVQALVERTVSRFGRLDCAVNNAGINVTSRLPHPPPPRRRLGPDHRRQPARCLALHEVRDPCDVGTGWRRNC